MSKAHKQRKLNKTPERTAVAGHVFRFSLKGIPAVDMAMEARLEAAARKPRKDRCYPVMIEAPDA